jgi:translation initiation factor 2 subunit 2
MDYSELLKRARQNLPETKTGPRFEMPSAYTAALKRSTVIKNFAEIAKALRRDPKHLARFLFKELAMPGTITGNELILNGKVSSMIINQRLRDYLSEYVICKECGKPDTNLTVDAGVSTIKCEACGARKTFKNAK